MIMELDQEEQDAIDAADDKNSDLIDDAASEEDGQMEFLQELERIDRQLQAVEQDKAETMKDFNEQIKTLKNRRADTLDSLENYRLGERSLPLG